MMNSGQVAHVGEVVCDCRYVHQVITDVNRDDPDFVTLADGTYCSYAACCDPVPHPEWEHPVKSGPGCVWDRTP